MPSHDGGCLCGSIRFRVTAPKIDSGYCHCRICQQNSGAPVVAWVTFPASGFAWILGEPGTYRSSPQARRQFCATCGSYMAFVSDRFAGEVSINTASFDDPGVFPPEMHIFTKSQISWLHIDDGLPRYEDYGGSSST